MPMPVLNGDDLPSIAYCFIVKYYEENVLIVAQRLFASIQFVRVIAIFILGQFWFDGSGQFRTGGCQELHALLGNADFRSLFRY